MVYFNIYPNKIVSEFKLLLEILELKNIRNDVAIGCLGKNTL